MKETEQQFNKHRVITMLDRDEVEFLDKIGKDSLFSTGHKLSYSQILKGLIDLAMSLGLTGENTGSVDKLENRMLELIRLKGA